MLLHAHFLFNELAKQATALHGKNNDLCAIMALLAEAEKDQLALHKQSAAHLRDCERRAKEYMELLSPTVLVKMAPTFFHTNQQRQMSANPNVASPTPRTPTGQPKITGNNPKWDRHVERTEMNGEAKRLKRAIDFVLHIIYY